MLFYFYFTIFYFFCFGWNFWLGIWLEWSGMRIDWWTLYRITAGCNGVAHHGCVWVCVCVKYHDHRQSSTTSSVLNIGFGSWRLNSFSLFCTCLHKYGVNSSCVLVLPCSSTLCGGLLLTGWHEWFTFGSMLWRNDTISAFTCGVGSASVCCCLFRGGEGPNIGTQMFVYDSRVDFLRRQVYYGALCLWFENYWRIGDCFSSTG